ncbi:MAG: GFA family protein [Ensifer adhaerens]
MKKLYRGSCHCGAVQFECQLDLAQGIRRCNCSFCAKTRMQKSFALRDEFAITSGVEVLTSYRAQPSNWREGDVDHYFCSGCGIRPFSRGYLEDFLGHFYAVNVACLDGVSDEELGTAPIVYENGRDDDYENPPRDTRFM